MFFWSQKPLENKSQINDHVQPGGDKLLAKTFADMES